MCFKVTVTFSCVSTHHGAMWQVLSVQNLISFLQGDYSCAPDEETKAERG